MKTYLITYNLINPKANLDNLIYAIRLIAVNFSHPMPDVWKITTGMSASDIQDHLGGTLKIHDRLMVTQTTDTHLADMPMQNIVFDRQLASETSPAVISVNDRKASQDSDKDRLSEAGFHHGNLPTLPC